MVKIMKIASVSLFAKPEQIGGGHIPAIAFKKWCKIKGIDCDVIDFFNLDNPEYLNNYDAVFIASPINDSDFKKININVPYAVMVHAEFDLHKDNLLALKNANVIPVIQEGFWLFDKQVAWHPCTFPEFLFDGTEEIDFYNKRGTVYSGRVTQWKNIYMLACASASVNLFNTEEFSISVYGTTNSDNCKNALKSIDTNWTWINKPYDINKFSSILNTFKFHWDVFGRPDKTPISMKRLNLAAIEALKFGVLPVTNSTTSPGFRFEIPYKPFISCGYLPRLIKEKQDNLINMIMETHLNYYAIEKQIDKILHNLIG